MRQYLPFLLVLACPLMMFFMMRGMMGHGSHGKSDAKGALDMATRIDETTSPTELHQLRDDLTVCLGQVDARLEGLEHAESSWKTSMRA
jgi:hypothetical protein